MGIARCTILPLLEEARRKPFHGRVLTLGRQAIITPRPVLTRLMLEHGLKAEKVTRGDGDTVTDQEFFHSLGFEEIESVDYSDFENATHIADLGAPDLPEHLRERFDLVVDGGTIEHIFHLPNVLKNVFAALRVGGRVIHASPMTGFFDHGFYEFSPTLFVDYYSANQFELNCIWIIRIPLNGDGESGEIFEYNESMHYPARTFGFDNRLYGVFVVATKTQETTCGVTPQQGFYLDAWRTGRISHRTLAASVTDRPAPAEAVASDTQPITRQEQTAAQMLPGEGLQRPDEQHGRYVRSILSTVARNLRATYSWIGKGVGSCRIPVVTNAVLTLQGRNNPFRAKPIMRF